MTTFTTADATGNTCSPLYARAATLDNSEMLFGNESESISKTEISTCSKTAVEWRSSVEPTALFWLIRFVAFPSLLFCLMLILWELRYFCSRDPSNPLPLPPGRMGLPLLGEMLQFFILVSRSFSCCDRCHLISFVSVAT